MGGQILGGGAIVLVVVLLWLVYLLPTWHARMRYSAAERNAVRLNQALRVLAESSEAPDEVRVELSRREIAKQHRLVKRLEAEDDRLREEYDRAEVERRRSENEAKLERSRQDAEAARVTRAIEAEEQRQKVAAMQADPRARQAAARRRGRLTATLTLLVGIATVGVGVWQLLAFAQWIWIAVGAAVAIAGLVALKRMSAVAARARRIVPVESGSEERSERSPSVLLNPEDRGWTPRPLPAPLTATAGSRASSEVSAARVRDDLRRAAREEAARERIIERQAPIPLAPAASDDAEIEQHVRDLLTRRAAG
ncbi:MAG: large exoprotein [Microbacterium gubbeenense]|uniref:large exoprotein n=1 Tax=Microbacterium gubbeenense TaxID=159896 RepID=UPI003F9DFF77